MNMKKEDYLEEMYKIQCRNNRVARVSELAHALKVSDSSVSEMIRKLEKEKLVTFEHFGGVSLTAPGIKEARKIIRKHQLLEVFFSKVLKIRTHSHEEAHLMEHVLSDAATDKLDSVLKKPKVCPDGNPIPEKNSEVVELTCSDKFSDCSKDNGSPCRTRNHTNQNRSQYPVFFIRQNARCKHCRNTTAKSEHHWYNGIAM